MSNRLEELHYQYKRYTLKKALKGFGIGVSLLALSSVIYLLFQANISSEDQEVVVKKSAPEKTVIKTKIIKESSNPQSMARPSYRVEVSNDDLDAAVIKMNNKDKTSDASMPSQVKPVKKTEVKALKSVQSQTSYFNSAQVEQPLEIWIEKYNQNKSYSSAIYIAKQYYFDKDFKQSGIWAKRANQLDRNKEEAWIYYAKSVYALGNVSKAKRILNIFLQYKKSLKAELLLSEWEQ